MWSASFVSFRKAGHVKPDCTTARATHNASQKRTTNEQMQVYVQLEKGRRVHPTIR